MDFGGGEIRRGKGGRRSRGGCVACDLHVAVGPPLSVTVELKPSWAAGVGLTCRKEYVHAKLRVASAIVGDKPATSR